MAGIVTATYIILIILSLMVGVAIYFGRRRWKKKQIDVLRPVQEQVYIYMYIVELYHIGNYLKEHLPIMS